MPRDEADDVLQAFVADKLLRRSLFESADRERGKFRSLLIKSLDNYRISLIRRESSRRRHSQELVVEEIAGASAVPAPDPFDLAWVRTVLEGALRAMKASCDEKAWRVAEARLFAPFLCHAEAVSYEALARELNFSSPAQAHNALVTAKRCFCRCFAEVAGTYCDESESVDQVLAQIIDLLSRAGPQVWTEVAQELEIGRDLPQPEHGLLDSEPALIAQALRNVPDPAVSWSASDLAGLCHDLLNSDVSAVLDQSSATAELTLKAALQGGADTALLSSIKRAARGRIRADDQALPAELIQSVYFAAIAAALTRTQSRITSSSDDVLRLGFEMGRQREWLPDWWRALFTRALAQLAARKDI